MGLRNPITLFIATLVIVASQSGCSSTQVHPAPSDATPQMLTLPAPLDAIRDASTARDTYRDGATTSALLPQNRVAVEDNSLQFTPGYTTNGQPLANAAYAGYELAQRYVGKNILLHFGWAKAPALGRLWIGLANFETNRWDWVNVPDTGTLGLPDLLPYSSQNNMLLVQIIVLGSDPVELNWLRLGPALQVQYVKAAAAPGGDGLSWATAFNDLQLALAGAAEDSEIWVAEGTYMPGSSRADTFTLKTRVALYGGFAGTETVRFERDWDSHVALLSGDIGIPGDTADNVLHVVTGTYGAILDGFTISFGNADDTADSSTQSGGGMYNYRYTGIIYPPIIANCTFSNNYAISGGGMFNKESSPEITACRFIDNSGDRGGGMYNSDGSSPVITDCVFQDNYAAFIGGGLINANASELQLLRCTFSNNSSGVNGGGLAFMSDGSHSTDCTFTANTSRNGGGVYVTTCNATFTNCSFTSNTAVTTGGGMQCEYSGDAVLTNCSFLQNSALYGGGLGIRQNSAPVLNSCDFNGNTGTEAGGAIFSRYSCNAVLYNNVISGNVAAMGGAVYNRNNCEPRLVNCSICGNTAGYGGALSNHETSSPKIVNCVLWGNSTGESVAEVYNEVDCLPQISHTCLAGSRGSGAVWNLTLGADIGGNIDQDPRLSLLPNPGADSTWGTADDEYGFLCQIEGSPLIDAGDSDALPISNRADHLGQPRFSGSDLDMGAYEFQP